MKKIAINTPKAPAAVGPYEQAVRVGPFLHTSGQIPLDPATGTLVPGEIEAATERVILNLQAVLEAGGSSLAHVVKTTVFLTDMALFPRVNAVYEKFFAAAKPARSCVEVSKLPKGAVIEMEAVALVEETEDVVVVFVTVPSEEKGLELAKGLVEGKLAACVNLIPSLRSIYFWEGKVCDDRELLLLIKTKREMFPQVSEWVLKNHGYEVPEVVALSITDGSKKYLDWVRANCVD